ncbi:hypothetical protein DNTS_024588, partial [Danionella cerebrum]
YAKDSEKWAPGVITEVTGPLSYRVRTSDGQVHRRHVDQLRDRIAPSWRPSGPESEDNNASLPNSSEIELPELRPTTMEFEHPGEEDAGTVSMSEPPCSRRYPLVERVFDESLNFRKIPPAQTKTSETNGRTVELRPRAPDSLDPQTALRRRTWNRDEAVLDSLLLTSVILFKDKDRKWDDIESKLSLDSEVPLPKTSNKDISSILTELKRIEKQLQLINVMVDPDGTLDALTSLGLTSPTTPKPKSIPGSQSIWPSLPSNGTSHPVPGATVTNPGPDKPSTGLGFIRKHLSGGESAIASK